MHDDTIIAQATPPGEGGVSVVRLSGRHAETCLEEVFTPSSARFPLAGHRLVHGTVATADGQVFDEVLAVVMRPPRSYTGECVVEIHCHGSQLIVRQLIDVCLQHRVRIAQPGEFTLRAFLNGRLDLSQAEGVIDLIRAGSERAARIACAQLEGDLSRRIHALRDPLLEQRSLVEAYIDFPEEDLPAETEQLLGPVRKVLQEVELLCASFDQGRIVREGLGVLILGRPNVGKSSLLNALVGEARAIVTEIPGTTRDVLEETVRLDGLAVRLIDTAGIRDAVDPVEQEGVRRARSRIALADVVVLVTDGSRPLEAGDRELLEACGDTPVIVVRNKADLGLQPLEPFWQRHPVVETSLHAGSGMHALRQALIARCCDAGRGGEESFLLCDRRHLEALQKAAAALRRFLDGWGGLTLDLLALELREALDHLGVITGETTPDEVLEAIFSRFCIGK